MNRIDLEKRITELVIPDTGQSFNGNDFRALCGPGVYILLKDDSVLYVGMGNNVLRRISGWHKQRKHFNECSSVLVYRTRNTKDAYKLERILIGHLRPQANSRGKYSRIADALGITHIQKGLKLALDASE